ncbi:Protein of unknown function [Halolactibacillus halophilus]|uniref:DUF2812 domain-containing protein n=1 Tax=Halolactibacillus halophilus TaxID=306540 RepID=A0A1I5RJI6_9BACI|nr:DUF2812 domain-containing protein [Halolactibacillus halophilus]GEM02986.1 hypothetical protein HHA03_25180 [Halolactibacillus halophilus]SFP58692.1 Protein of unknown function [Halolactibacillus halophilus]
MKDKSKRIMNFRFDRYEDAEKKLEKLAAKGMFLEECGSFLWTFRKGTPKKLKYTVTYFSEGSVFNPGITDNQQTYIEYAKAAGWDFVTQFNQMQIFCSEADNQIPFETDEKEKLNNIKKCMKKSFLPSMIVMILVFILNLIVQFNSFQLNPIDYLSDPIRLLSSSMIATVIIYHVYSLMTYFLWLKRSEKSIAFGGECVKNSKIVYKIVDIIFMVFLFGSLGYLMFHLALKTSSFGLVLSIAQVPILMIVFWSSIKYLKKKKASATVNKLISYTVLIVASFAYLALLMAFIMRFEFGLSNESNYRTVDWQLSETESHEYRLYSHEIPLTSEDLYGPIDYNYYSYEKETDNTLFLSKSVYRQDSPPAKDAPPRIEYEMLEPRFDFVYRLVKAHLLEIPEWRDNTTFESIDNKIFETVEAYQRYYEDTPTGEYTLFFEDRIIVLNMEEPLTTKQILIIKEKLQI